MNDIPNKSRQRRQDRAHTSLAGRLPSSILASKSPRVQPLMTSKGSITLPRLFDIFRPYLSRTMACKYTVKGKEGKGRETLHLEIYGKITRVSDTDTDNGAGGDRDG